MEQITITSEMVKKTEAYKELSPIRQKLYLSRNNIKCGIEHGVNVVMNIGEEKWQKITNASYQNKMIVLEIVKDINGKK